MSELQLICTILIVAAQAGYIGYWVGRIREQNCLTPEILEERARANKYQTLLKLSGVKP